MLNRIIKCILAFCLICIILVVTPINSFAAEYTPVSINEGDILCEGDILKEDGSVIQLIFNFEDNNGSVANKGALGSVEVALLLQLREHHKNVAKNLNVIKEA